MSFDQGGCTEQAISGQQDYIDESCQYRRRLKPGYDNQMRISPLKELVLCLPLTASPFSGLTVLHSHSAPQKRVFPN